MNLSNPFVRVVGAGAALVLLMQFYRPPMTNPPVTAEVQAPENVKQVLRTSCYSCHSNQVELPWYDQIAPAYWLVQHDVREGRAHLNFSELGAKPAAAQRGVLFEAVNEIQMGAMPLPRYLAVHPGAVVTPQQLAVLRAYLEMPPAPAVATAPAVDADAQYKGWIAAGAKPLTVQPEPNGVAFMPEYKTWRPISSTERWDNGTMREILGNDVAQRAIKEHHINPWPDGTAFAKVAWLQKANADGPIRTGAFVQVELMIKDSQRYKNTAGWGWGRWRGMDLKPYGKGEHFDNECVSCHLPVAKNDYVYTLPIPMAASEAR